jgi:hypothetical protein
LECRDDLVQEVKLIRQLNRFPGESTSRLTLHIEPEVYIGPSGKLSSASTTTTCLS